MATMSQYYCSHDKLYFTAGLTRDQKHLLTGTPVEVLDEEENKTWGEGFCPNCGRDCKSTKEAYAPLPAGKDPNQPIHDEIAAAVADPDHPLTADGAQAALIAAVEGGVKA